MDGVEFVGLGTTTKRRWWTCPKCYRRNWRDRRKNARQCSGCGEPYTERSSWPEGTRAWILDRDFHQCTLGHLQPQLEDLVEKDSCAGLMQVIRPWMRQHGGPVKDPRNGITVCLRHADWLIIGRMLAREAYRGRDRAAFKRWYEELGYVSSARLPVKPRTVRAILRGVALERTERKEAWERKRKGKSA